MKTFCFCCTSSTPVACCDWFKVLVVLLEENQAERKSLSKLRTQKDTLSFSDGSLQLNTKLPFLYGTYHNQRNHEALYPWLYFIRCDMLIIPRGEPGCPYCPYCQSQVATSAWCTSLKSRDTPWCPSTHLQPSPVLCALTAAPSSASGTSGNRPGLRRSLSTNLRWYFFLLLFSVIATFAVVNAQI